MATLIAGLILWVAAHLLKRVAPGRRAALGAAGKGMIALVLVASVILMVIGYRSAEGAFFWGRSPALVGINNLLILIAFYLFAVGGPKGPRVWIGTRLRHPQLTGFAIWAGAHLLVNGDAPSLILFGGLLIWALAEIVIINQLDGPWVPPPRAGLRQEFTYVLAAVGLVGVVMVIHNWLGVQPWG